MVLSFVENLFQTQERKVSYVGWIQVSLEAGILVCSWSDRSSRLLRLEGRERLG